ncbi:MAG: PDZ domain-containing protein [Thermoplasmata archaeon]|nr:PDZ domain-containing protein [Thermoplasmata archaeon]
MTEPAALHYEIRASNPSDHRADVVLTIRGAGASPLELVVPSWIPGSYWIQDRVRNLSGVRANPSGGADPLPVRRLAKDRWRVEPGGHDSIEVHYSVYGNELRTALLDVTPEHLFVAAGFLFPYVEGRRDEPHDVAVVVPAEWSVRAELPEVGRHPPTFRAADYDELVDSPIDAGRPDAYTIHPAGIPHHIVFCGAGGNYEPHRVQDDVGKIVEATIRMFGESPVPSFTMFYHLTDRPSNGLEHARSFACALPPTSFRPESRYRDFLHLTSHEYLHLYNVKRIRPKAFDRFDYTRETYTRLLWAMEGTTDYLSYLILLRAGRIGVPRYLTHVAEKIHLYRSGAGRLHQSLEQASLVAWVDFYRRFEESPNRSISYYLKGDLVSLCLDLELRSATAGEHSVETAWREIWRSHGRSRIGLEEDELPTLLTRATGVDVGPFFDAYIRGTTEVDFERYLGLAGLELTSKSMPRKPDDDAEPGYLGVETETAGGLARLTVVRDGGPGRRAGLSPGDEVVAIDGGKVTYDQFPKALERSPPGTRVEIAVFRRGRLTTVPVVLGVAPPKELLIGPVRETNANARKVHESWLGIPWAPSKAPSDSSA